MPIFLYMDTYHLETGYLDKFMFVGISFEADELIFYRHTRMLDIDALIRSYFSDKNYGVGINELMIRLTLIRTQPGYENW